MTPAELAAIRDRIKHAPSITPSLARGEKQVPHLLCVAKSDCLALLAEVERLTKERGEFVSRLHAYASTDEHQHHCMAWSEGAVCCIDSTHPSHFDGLLRAIGLHPADAGSRNDDPLRR